MIYLINSYETRIKTYAVEAYDSESALTYVLNNKLPDPNYCDERDVKCMKTVSLDYCRNEGLDIDHSIKDDIVYLESGVLMFDHDGRIFELHKIDYYDRYQVFYVTDIMFVAIPGAYVESPIKQGDNILGRITTCIDKYMEEKGV